MSSELKSQKPAWSRLLSEPLLHFFTLGALLLAAHNWRSDDPRTITIAPGLKPSLSRRFQDNEGRPPTPEELKKETRKWQEDEALFREAMRRGLDQDDATVRGVLIAKMRELADLEAPKRKPSETELKEWLSSQSKKCEKPLRYSFHFLSFSKSEENAEEERERLETAIEGGAAPSKLGRPLQGANLALADMNGKIAPELAAGIAQFPIGEWQRVDTKEALLLVQVKALTGGLPKVEQLHDALMADWISSKQKDAAKEILQQTIRLYHFERRP